MSTPEERLMNSLFELSKKLPVVQPQDATSVASIPKPIPDKRNLDLLQSQVPKAIIDPAKENLAVLFEGYDKIANRSGNYLKAHTTAPTEKNLLMDALDKYAPKIADSIRKSTTVVPLAASATSVLDAVMGDPLGAINPAGTIGAITKSEKIAQGVSNIEKLAKEAEILHPSKGFSVANSYSGAVSNSGVPIVSGWTKPIVSLPDEKGFTNYLGQNYVDKLENGGYNIWNPVYSSHVGNVEEIPSEVEKASNTLIDARQSKLPKHIYIDTFSDSYVELIKNKAIGQDVMSEAKSPLKDNWLGEDISKINPSSYSEEFIPYRSIDKPLRPLTNQDLVENILHEKVGEAEGTNPGGWYLGKDGSKRYVKFYDNSTQAQSEFLANKIYQDLGINSPHSTLFEHKGKTAIASDEVYDHNKGNSLFEGQGGIDPQITKESSRRFLQGFVGDVLTGNWDVLGQNFDNIIWNHNPTRIDNGSAFLFRAQGAKKPIEGLNDITEWDKFANENPSYKKIFEVAGLSGPEAMPSDILRQIDNIKRFNWKNYVEENVPQMAADNKEKIINMLDARTGLLKQKEIEIRKSLQDGSYWDNLLQQDIKKGISTYTEEDLKGLPDWQKRLKVSISSKDDAELLIASINRDLIESNPSMSMSNFPPSEDQVFIRNLNEWFGSSIFTKQKVGEALLNPKDAHPVAVATLNAIKREPPAAPLLYRGEPTNHLDKFGIKIEDFIKQFEKGNEIDLLPSSFSTNRYQGEQFVGGPIYLRFELEPKAQAVKIGSVSYGHFKEEEWMTGGRYLITNVNKLHSQSFEVKIKHIGVFDLTTDRVMTEKEYKLLYGKQ